MSRIIITEASMDTFRRSIGKQKVVNNYGPNSDRITNNLTKDFNITFLTSDIVDKGFLYEEKSILKIETANDGTLQSFRDKLTGLMPLNTVFTDHYVSIDQVSSENNVEGEHIGQTITSYNIQSVYNYLSPQYDLDSSAVNEVFYPSVMDRKQKTDFVDYKRLGKSSPLYSSDLGALNKFVVPNMGKNRIVDLNCLNVKNNYPYYNEIRIANKVSNRFTNFMDKIEMFDIFLSDYIESSKSQLYMNIQNGNTVIKNTPVPYYNAATWAQSTDLKISPELKFQDMNFKKYPKMIIDYKKTLFAGYIKSLSKNGFRSYEDICNNAECYKEDLVYSVKKFKNNSIGAPLQEFYLPITRDLTEFTDTQVKYGQLYIYQCKSHQLIVGNKYQYKNLKFHDSGKSYYATVEVHNTPTVIVVPFNVFTHSTKTIQPPPIFPQVKFVSEMDSKSKVDVYLSPTKGEKLDQFIKILPNDDLQIRDININHGSVLKEKGQVSFKTLTEQGVYEVFKTDTPPISYDDFRNKKITNVSMSFLTDDAIFRDCVEPNSEDNYFMFRKVNSKGLVSNPSPIYKVKLLIDADDSRLFVSEYHIPKKTKNQKTIKFKRLFQITPAVEQVMYDPNQESLNGITSLKGKVERLQFGWATESVWGKKFKFRIKSTTSGKIIDYNITFKLTKDKTDADFN